MFEGRKPTPHKVSQLSISACMTAYNEEAVIANTVYDCVSVLEKIPGNHEILVVNDGCTDKTGDILHKLSEKYSLVRVLVHPENKGYVEAQRWLIREARGDLIFHFASDGEWKACELYGMLKTLCEGYDIVVSIRRNKHYSLYRKLISSLYNILVLILFQKNFYDIGSIRLVNARLWKQIPVASNSAFFMAEKLLLAHRNGARIGFTMVDHVWRASGKSKFSNPLRSLDAFVDLFKFRFSPRNAQTIHFFDAQERLNGVINATN